MLSNELNELICRVGPGTPMGEMLREYWWPVLRCDRLEADGDPVRVRLLGEDWVAFRATDGRVGVIDERCPHRSVSMMLARNEDCALRCILHGWKISVDGKVVDTPNEKEDPARMARLRVRHLPVEERAGMVWVWAGKGEPAPFPNYAFNEAVEATAMVGYYRCNWFQLMETLWDPTHVAILHAQGSTFNKIYEGLEDDDAPGAASKTRAVFYLEGLQTRDDPYGFSYRFTGEGKAETTHPWTNTVMPSWVYIPGVSAEGDQSVLGHVPIDDENVMLVHIAYNSSQPIGELGKRFRMGVTDFDDFVPASHHKANNWNQDRHAMRRGESVTGIGMGMYAAGILLQDQAALESMGGIVDRTYEQIGPSDHAIVKGRNVFIEAVKAHTAGEPALGVGEDLSQIGRPVASKQGEAA